MLKTRLDQDLKTALLAGDQVRVTVLRGLKSAILYVEVEQGTRNEGLDDESVLQVLTKESKKRRESADLYKKGGDNNRAQAELDEKAIIDSYLPQQLGEEELSVIIDDVLDEVGRGPKFMGQAIVEIKKRCRGRADGARIASIVRERISEQK